MYVDVMQVRNSEIYVFQQWIGARRSGGGIGQHQKTAYSGNMSAGARKRITKAIVLMIQSSPVRWIWNSVAEKWHQFRLGFVTLTLHDDRGQDGTVLYKELLSKVLRWFRSRGLRKYIWKAERQERGAIHYHIVIDQFLHYQDLQDYWNGICRKGGYLAEYAKKNGHYRPNSVDVHSVYQVKDIEAYIGKYISKDVGGKGIGGKVWDCSETLKNTGYYTTELTPSNLEKLRKIGNERQLEFCTIFKIPQGAGVGVLDAVQQIEYNSHIARI